MRDETALKRYREREPMIQKLVAEADRAARKLAEYAFFEDANELASTLQLLKAFSVDDE